MTKKKSMFKFVHGLKSIGSKEGTQWRNLRQNRGLPSARASHQGFPSGSRLRKKAAKGLFSKLGSATSKIMKGPAGKVAGKVAGQALSKAALPLSILGTSYSVGRAAVEGAKAHKASMEAKRQKIASEMKYGTSARATAYRHYKTIPGARSNIERKIAEAQSGMKTPKIKKARRPFKAQRVWKFGKKSK